jgi:hypothetical protein
MKTMTSAPIAGDSNSGDNMDRNNFAAGKKVDEEAKPAARAKEKVADAQKKAGGLQADGKKMIGEGHAIVGKTLIPDSFIEKMDAYIPDKKKK